MFTVNQKNIYRFVLIVFVSLMLTPLHLDAQTNGTVSSAISVGSHDILVPGESLPVNVQLLNFGTPNERVDVSMLLRVIDKNGSVISEYSETVAVQTTASFVRYIQLPESINYGEYILKLHVSYKNQMFPAISEQRFKVERSFLGYGISKWVPTLPFALIPFFLLFLFIKRRERVRLINRDYTHISEDQRTNYEIVHDIIDALHYHVGDKKIKEIASHVPGLEVDDSGSQIKSLTGPTEDIVSTLIHEYEEVMGKKVNVIPHPPYTKKRIHAN